MIHTQSLVRAAFLLTFLAPWAGSAPLQQRFPLAVSAFDEAAGKIELEPRPGALAPLLGMRAVTFAGVPLPDGSMVDLELERLDLARLELGFRVNGVPAPALLVGLELSVWRGRVAGDPGSHVQLSFSNHGSRGWIARGGEIFHLVPAPGGPAGAPKSWSQAGATLVSESTLLSAGARRGDFCNALPLPGTSATPRAPASASLPPPLMSSLPLYTVKIAVETDYQLHQVFGNNLQAQTAYVTTLLAWIGYRYEEQVSTLLSYPYVQFYTTPNDPWAAPDFGGSSIDLLFEFQAAWQFNIPAGAHLATFLSGAGLGGGVAWLPGLCDPPYNFSVCGDMGGDVTFPVQPSPSNWDFMVVAHELGHNLGAPHTQDYCPPVDQCPPSGWFGQCQNTQVCTDQGTLMSYCHLCPGGLANVTTYFHPQSVADMRALVESSCVPVSCPTPSVYCQAKLNSAGCLPSIDWSGNPTLSGLDNLLVRATSVVNQQLGVQIWSLGSANVPFQGGTLCLASPVVRAPAANSGGTPTPAHDCSGTLSFPWTHAYMGTQGMLAGTSVFAQFWYRDPLSSFGTGLTNALSFTLCP